MADQGRVIVLGSINIDTQIRVEAFPLPGQTIAGQSMRTGLGGKGANQAVAASRAGAPTALHGHVGSDGMPLDRLRQLAPNLDLKGVTIDPGATTGSAFILLDRQGENSIIVIAGANRGVLAPGWLALSASDICLAQLEIPTDAIAGMFQQARAVGARTVLNTAPALAEARDLFPLCDILVMNETELAFYAGDMPLAQDALADAARSLLTGHHQTVLVTLGAAGALHVDARGHTLVPARKAAHVRDTTGAGDCFCGTLCAGLAQGLSLAAAMARAHAAAALQVGREGAAEAMPDADEIAAASRKNPRT